MNSYLDFSQYTDNEILRMQKEKRKEYIVLIQSERIAKKLLNSYGESLYTTNYHYRLNSEYYLLNERISKKKINVEEENKTSIKIPVLSIISRLNESKSVVLKSSTELYTRYSVVTDEIINKLNSLDLAIVYKDGYLYYVTNNNEEILLDDDTFNEIFEIKEKTLK